ncbi:MAG: O-antigen polymerase [Gammaproteobacteria bacterium]
MNSPDTLFVFVFVAYLLTVGGILYRLRSEPLYDPRVLFTLAAALWMFIVHGYVTGFEGYLAAKPGFYHTDIRLLSSYALAMMLVGLLSFVGGTTAGMRVKMRPASANTSGSLLVPVCIFLFALSVLNFYTNVLMISGGNVYRYLSEIAIRPYQVEESAGISASGYVLGFIGIQMLAYIGGRRGVGRRYLWLLSAGVAFMLIVRFSQGRIFQTLVLLGACYTAYSLGTASRVGRPIPWPKQIHLLFLMGAVGLCIYFLRIASALSHLGYKVTLESVEAFGSNLVHFALQRGNVPNFPIVFTLLDKMPSEEGFFHGSTLFNWAIFFIPKAILKADYLISLQIKRLWYTDIEGGGLPPTAVGEWYANFGLAGVLVGMFVVGLVMGLLYKRAIVSCSPYAAVLWANLSFGFIVIYPKTDLAQIPQYSMFVLFSLWALMLILRSALTGRRAST